MNCGSGKNNKVLCRGRMCALKTRRRERERECMIRFPVQTDTQKFTTTVNVKNDYIWADLGLKITFEHYGAEPERIWCCQKVVTKARYCGWAV